MIIWAKKKEQICCKYDELQKNIMEYTRSDSPKHFFVKEIEVGYQSDVFPNDICLVDTPGLEDPVKYRSDITRKYLKRAQWIIACIRAENLCEKKEFDFVEKVMANINRECRKVFVVATKKDQLLENERKEKRDEFLARIKQLYNKDANLAHSQFSFVCSECHTLSKAFVSGEDLSDENKRKLNKMLMDIDFDIRLNDLTEAQVLRKVLEYAEVESFLKKMDDRVIKRKRDELLNNLGKEYSNTMKKISDYVNGHLSDKNNDLKNIICENDMEQDEICDLEEKNIQIQKLINQVKLLKEKLDDEIKINQMGDM